MTRQQLSILQSGYLTSDKDFDDYGIKAHREYRIHHSGDYAYIWAAGEIRIDNNEIRDDMLEHLSYGE